MTSSELFLYVVLPITFAAVVFVVCNFDRFKAWLASRRRQRMLDEEAELDRYQHDVLVQAIRLNEILGDAGHEARVAMIRAAAEAERQSHRPFDER